MRKLKSKAWIKRIRKGDVLKMPSGALRVVRGVSHHGPSNGKTNVMFAIRHCSWTHRPYTTLTGNDLVQFGYRPTGACVTLRKKIDKLIEHDAHGREGKYPLMPADTVIHCCDVRGIA